MWNADRCLQSDDVTNSRLSRRVLHERRRCGYEGFDIIWDHFDCFELAVPTGARCLLPCAGPRVKLAALVLM